MSLDEDLLRGLSDAASAAVECLRITYAKKDHDVLRKLRALPEDIRRGLSTSFGQHDVHFIQERIVETNDDLQPTCQRWEIAAAFAETTLARIVSDVASSCFQGNGSRTSTQGSLIRWLVKGDSVSFGGLTQILALGEEATVDDPLARLASLAQRLEKGELDLAEFVQYVMRLVNERCIPAAFEVLAEAQGLDAASEFVFSAPNPPPAAIVRELCQLDVTIASLNSSVASIAAALDQTDELVTHAVILLEDTAVALAESSSRSGRIAPPPNRRSGAPRPMPPVALMCLQR